MTGRKKLSTYSVPILFEKLEQKNLIHTGIIIIPEVIARETYNRLYENQNNLESKYWHDITVKFTFLKNLEDIKDTETKCIWFFRERPDTTEYKKYCRDNNLNPYRDFIDLKVAGHNIKYETNTMLITNKNIDVHENKFVLRRPCVQIDLDSVHITSRKKIRKLLQRDLG